MLKSKKKNTVYKSIKFWPEKSEVDNDFSAESTIYGLAAPPLHSSPFTLNPYRRVGVWHQRNPFCTNKRVIRSKCSHWSYCWSDQSACAALGCSRYEGGHYFEVFLESSALVGKFTWTWTELALLSLFPSLTPQPNPTQPDPTQSDLTQLEKYHNSYSS